MNKLLFTFAIVALFAFTACANGGDVAAGTDTANITVPAQQPATETNDDASETARTYLSVLTWDRGGVGHQDSANNYFTRWINERVLEDLNMYVYFEAIGRWDENEQLPIIMAAGAAPDLAMTWNAGMVDHFGNLGGITDLAPLLDEHLHRLPDLNFWLDDLLWQNQDPLSGQLFSIHQRRTITPRMVPFIREDWLNTLGIPLPTTTDQFIDALKAFRDYADVLGVENMVPLVTTDDIRWRLGPIPESFIDMSISDEDLWIYSIGDRYFLLPGYSEGVRVLSQMFDEGLIFPDFPLYFTDEFTDNLTIANQVGAYIHSWDQPWRTTPDIQNRLNEVDPNARFVAIDPFQNPQTGRTQRIAYPSFGFHVFIPASSRNPVGALEYLDWMSRLENRLFLQIGDEGYHHEMREAEGHMVPAMLPVDAATSERRMYSPNNVDLTLVINNIDVGDTDANFALLAFNFPGIDAERVIDSIAIAHTNSRAPASFTVPGRTPISAEFAPTFQQMTAEALTQVIMGPAEDFDELWEAAVQNILNAGAQAAIDERRAGIEALAASND